jgi:hypothetical protein
MKRFFQIILGAIAFILLLLIVLPSLFKGKIEQKVVDVINENIEATVSFDKFNLSMFRHFPDLSMGLDGLTIVNKEPFQGDTLMHVATFSASIDFWSAIKGDKLEVNSIIIDQPQVSLKVNQDSIANWDVIPMTETPETEVEEDTSDTSDFAVQLKHFEIREAKLGFSDATMSLDASIDDLNVSMDGDLSQQTTNLDLNTTIQALNVEFEDVKYVKNAIVSLDAIIEADLENMIFAFQENEFKLNDLALGFDGTIGLPEEGYDLDLKLAAKETEFKTLLSLVPEAYLKDFEDLQAAGTLKLEVTAKGRYIDTDHLPAFDMVLNVNNGQIQYPDLPESIDDVQIDMIVNNPGGDMDLTVTNIRSFHFELGNNPFDASLWVGTPVSNATYRGSLKGTIDLNSLSNAIPMDSMELRGIISSNLSVNGNYEMVENEQYEEIEARGTMSLKNFFFSSPDLTYGFLISEADLKITPRFMELKTFKSSIGKSDFDLKGRLENYLSYAMKGGTLKGNLDHRSKLIDANELMKLAGDENSTEVEDTTAMELVIVPKNLNFTFNSNIDEFLYDKLEMTNVKGSIRVIDCRVLLDGLSSNMLDGRMIVSGEYNTADTLKPFVDFDMNLQSIDVNKAANSFSMVDSLMPIAKKAHGSVTTKMRFNSLMAHDMSPVLGSINGGGLLESKGIEVSGAKVQNALATMLNNEKYRQAQAKNLAVNFVLKDGNVRVKPFTTNLFGKNLTISGTQGLDQTIDYIIKMPVSKSELKSVSSLLGASLSAFSEEVMVDILVQGTISDPKLKFNIDEEFKNKVKEEAKEKVIEEAEKAFDKLKDDPEVKEKLNEAKEKLKKWFE